jgi:hypothetical protein
VRRPRDVNEGPLIADARTAAVSDLFNGCYEVLIEVLLRFFVHEGAGDAEMATLSDAAVGAMFTVIAPLGRLLTRLPVGPEAPGQTAGPTFDIFRRSYLLPYREAAWVVLNERLRELAEGGAEIGRQFAGAGDAGARATMTDVERSLRALAETFASTLAR